MPNPQDWLDPDRAYANGDFIADAKIYRPKWLQASAAFRAARLAAGRGAVTLTYGPDPRQKLDLFQPDAPPLGLLVFVHGGYWMDFGREDWSHLAAGALARGWACALPSYRLAPQVPMSTITDDVRAALATVMPHVPGPVVVTGHSAGGHLAARMGCQDGPPGIARVVPISPLSDLEPLLQTAMQTKLNLTADDCRHESPARLPLAKGVSAHVWVGGQERPSFLWQARVLSEAWACPWTVAPDRHHFDVIDALADPGSALMRACLDGI
jgi:arylformamidase